ncbi:MAG: RepB family protein, partial [Sphaerospermopsis kisseleviana]
MKTTIKQINIRCSSESKGHIDNLCRNLKCTQSQLIEKLIENYQKPSTENEQIEELEGNYQELVKVNQANAEIIKRQQLEIKQLQETVNSQKIEELKTMIDRQTTDNTHNSDLEALEARFEARFQQLGELIKNQISPQSPVTSPQSPVPSEESAIPSPQSTVTSSQLPVPSYQSARDKNQQELELMGNAELWGSRKTGVAEEKIRRCFVAISNYNNELATGDNDRVAITNIVLRQLSGANGKVVGNW